MTTSITPIPHPSSAHQKPEIRSFLVADVKCYMCGSHLGSIESEQQPMPRSVQFKKAGEEGSVQLLDWRRLRCDRCNGPVFLDEADVITRRVDHYNWLEERPRRGRPPKRLVEERRRLAALLAEGSSAEAA